MKRKTKKEQYRILSLFLCVIFIGIFAILSCSDPTNESGGSANPDSYTGTASSNGKAYSLQFFSSRAIVAPAESYYYDLKITSNGSSKLSQGVVSKINGTLLTLTPSNSAQEIIVQIENNKILAIIGTITFTDNTTEKAPGAFSVSTDVIYIDTRGNNVIIPGGAASCAMKVISFTHGTSWTSDPKAMDESKILGVPDYDPITDKDYICLGIPAGEIVIEFGVSFTDGTGNDIYVFEVGPDVEDTKVEISSDLVTWLDIGNVNASISGIDINGQGTPGIEYKYIRLTDVEGIGSSWPGADIDAVAIMHPALLTN